MDNFTLISLFSGAGGMDLGFKKAGFDILWANDFFKEATETYKKNIGNHVVYGDITQIESSKIPNNPDVVIGGFPCLTGDSLILTETGYKKLIYITREDKVLSHDRKYHKVLNFFNQGKKEVYEISSDCFDSIKATINHRFYAMKKNGTTFYNPDFYSLETILEEGFENFYFANVSTKVNKNTDWYESLDLEEDIEDFLDLYAFLPKYLLEDIMYNYFQRNDNFSSPRKSDIYEFAHLVLKGLNKPYKITKENNEYVLRLEDENEDIFFEKGYLWYPIKNIEKLGEEFVYDIEVKDSHSFVVNGCVSHNCQGFSIANNKRSMKDERNFLYKELLRVIKDKNPKFFVAENVKGLLSMEDGKVIKMIIKDFEDLGYKVDYKVLNAAEYGIPQARERVIIIGNRLDLENPFPKVTHYINNPIEGLIKCPTVKDTIENLAKVNLSENEITLNDGTKIYNHNAYTNVKDTYIGRTYEVNQEELCDYLRKYKTLRKSSNKKIAEGIGEKQTKVDHWFRKDNKSGSIPSKEDYLKLKDFLDLDDTYDKQLLTYEEKEITFEQSLRVTNWDRPSDTITATGPEIHINKQRRLSVREVARLQTFPDDFIFTGNLEKMYRQVGNAVPVNLAYLIANEIKNKLKNSDEII